MRTASRRTAVTVLAAFAVASLAGCAFDKQADGSVTIRDKSLIEIGTDALGEAHEAASYSDTEKAYLSAVEDDVPDLVRGVSDDEMLAVGREWCTYLDSGMTPELLATAAADSNPDQATEFYRIAYSTSTAAGQYLCGT